MRYIKVLSMFVIFAVALLLISTIRTYAGISAGDVALIQCDGDLVVIKIAITDEDNNCSDTGENADCEPGDPCEDCLEACIGVGYSPDIEQSGSGKITFVLTGTE